MEEVINFLQIHSIPYQEYVDLKKKTWIHRGGTARLYIQPMDAIQLGSLVGFLYKKQTEFLVVGHTSNLYILNSTNLEVVISTIKCNHFRILGDVLECECGASVQKIARQCNLLGLKGVEYLTELPGTIGGALCNNSSCKESVISELMIGAKVITNDGKILTLSARDFKFQFRSSSFKRHEIDGVILSAKFKLTKGNAETLKKIAADNEAEREKVLEGPAHNLGCTVHKPFCLGEMPKRYSIPYRIVVKLLSLCMDKQARDKKAKLFLFFISGYYSVEQYVSDKNPLVFLWKEPGADALFSKYIEFMEKVYRTNKVEIQVI